MATREITVYLTEQEYQEVALAAADAGMSADRFMVLAARRMREKQS